MRRTLPEMLRCPACGAERSFDIEVTDESPAEIREGALTCVRCGASYEVSRGIVDLLHNPPDFVRREAGGLARFADLMRRDGWDRERILALPNEDSGYWFAQRGAFDQLLRDVPLRPGEKLLDVGSNTCWASNRFAELGLDVVALDITTTEMQGLDTAEYFFDASGVYFERLLGTMFDPGLASNSLDYVFCCEVLHHNDRHTLPRTFEQLHRILKPGGKLLVINETMKFPLELKRDHAQEVAEFEGYEHTFFFPQYYAAARRAGFSVSVREPQYWYFLGRPLPLEADTPVAETLKRTMLHLSRRSRVGRRLYLAYRNLIAGRVALNLICTKRDVA